MRTADFTRKTTETSISCTLSLDAGGTVEIETGCGFLNHMLELFARHGRFGLNLTCNGDKQVDYHHTVEDVGIVMGRAFSKALGDCAGIFRYGSMLLPMDEALVQCAVDVSGRGFLAFGLQFPSEKVGDFDTELVQEFFTAFSRELGATIHVIQLAGENSHHIAEAAFKGVARALASAVAIDSLMEGEIPSTKGTIV